MSAASSELVIYMGKKQLIVRTQAELVKALAGRGLIVGDRTLRDWFSIKDCPGKSAIGYDVNAVEKFARVHSENAAETPADRKKTKTLQRRLKEEKIKQEEFKTAEMARLDEVARGNILPLDECIEIIASIIAVARTELMAIPKEVASLATEPDLQQRIVSECSQRVAKILESLSLKLCRVPEDAKKGSD